MTKRDVHNGKPYAGNPHMRFDDGEDASATSRCGSLFCKRLLPRAFCMVVQILGLSASVFGGVRPYEFEWANRTRDDRPVLLPLESAKGWTCRWSQATGRVETAREHLLFGDGVMRITHIIRQVSFCDKEGEVDRVGIVALTGDGDVDLVKISKIINESGYEGYLSVEFEGWEDPLFACPRAIKNVKTLLRG